LIRYPFECGHITQYKDVIFDGRTRLRRDGKGTFATRSLRCAYQPPLSGE
jgi:hypothetical protein